MRKESLNAIDAARMSLCQDNKFSSENKYKSQSERK